MYTHAAIIRFAHTIFGPLFFTRFYLLWNMYVYALVTVCNVFNNLYLSFVASKNV